MQLLISHIVQHMEVSMLNEFTSTGSKFFAHQEVMTKLRNGRGQPIVTHIMLTDVCNHSCAFCSVQARAGDSLAYADVMAYLDLLQPLGLKAVILSGGGNPILYKRDGKDFNDVVDAIHARGLEIGLITNGMPLQQQGDRASWKNIAPETLDKCTWIRISMAGLDHAENEVYVPDIGPNTTLGFSYVAHDIWDTPEDKHHGKVSTVPDLYTLGVSSVGRTVLWFEDRIPELTQQIGSYVAKYNPRYVRMLPNCLEPSLIPLRCQQLQAIADSIDPSICFVQQKPPKAPHSCFLGYVHPVLNCDGYVYPCDSCVLNEAAGHTFANPWRICHWSEITSIYEQPVRSLIADPAKLCPGCVFSGSNEILRNVVNGMETPDPGVVTHANFV